MTRRRGRRPGRDSAIDIIGVMPEPAAISTWLPGRARSGVKAPVGGITSITSPGRTPSTSQDENRPPGTSRTPMRGACAGRGADRVRPPLLAPVELPAQGERLARPEGELVCQVRRHLEGDGDGVRAQPLDVGDPQRVEAGAATHGRRRAAGRWSARWARPSDLLDVLERFAAGAAAPQGLAGRGAEAGGLLGVRRAAARAGHRAPGRRRVSGTGPAARAAGPGGAMPCSASLRRPVSVIQSWSRAGASDGAHLTRA